MYLLCDLPYNKFLFVQIHTRMNFKNLNECWTHLLVKTGIFCRCQHNLTISAIAVDKVQRKIVN